MLEPGHRPIISIDTQWVAWSASGRERSSVPHRHRYQRVLRALFDRRLARTRATPTLRRSLLRPSRSRRLLRCRCRHAEGTADGCVRHPSLVSVRFRLASNHDVAGVRPRVASPRRSFLTGIFDRPPPTSLLDALGTDAADPDAHATTSIRPATMSARSSSAGTAKSGGRSSTHPRSETPLLARIDN